MSKLLLRTILEIGTGCAFFAIPACHRAETPAPAPQSVLGETDRSFIIQAQRDRLEERAIGEFVKAKSRNKRIQTYADKLVQDQSDALRKLDAVMHRYGVNELVDASEQSDAIAPLKSLSRGSIDRQFIRMMAEDHQRAIAAFQQEANSAENADVRRYAIDSLPMLDDHLKEAQELQGKKGKPSRAQRSRS